MATQSVLPAVKKYEFDISDVAILKSSLDFKITSTKRYLKAQVPGTLLYNAYDQELSSLIRIQSLL